ncbi:EamA family transporter, partial [Ensifer soli]|uniref:EamA family transporter n=1 Tax=Ciceribacter sp. sgz301302 TaxID=3342379 RepID=UPI0035BB930F
QRCAAVLRKDTRKNKDLKRTSESERSRHALGRARETPFAPRSLGLALASAFFGTTLGMSLLMAALHEGDVGIVATLSSMTPVVVLPMVWLRTGERPPARAWLGAALAIAGTALISLR